MTLQASCFRKKCMQYDGLAKHSCLVWGASGLPRSPGVMFSTERFYGEDVYWANKSYLYIQMALFQITFTTQPTPSFLNL